MTFSERTLFDSPEATPHRNEVPANERPIKIKSLEERRRILAEERTGQIVAKVPNVGYVALSVLYEQQPSTDIEPPTAA